MTESPERAAGSAPPPDRGSPRYPLVMHVPRIWRFRALGDGDQE